MAKLRKVTGEKSGARTNDMHGCKLQNFNIAAKIVFKFHTVTHQNLCCATRLNIQSQSQYIYTMSTRPFFNGIIFLTILYATAFVGTIVVMGPTLFLLRLQPRWFRWINDRLTVIWLLLPPVGTSNITQFTSFYFLPHLSNFFVWIMSKKLLWISPYLFEYVFVCYQKLIIHLVTKLMFESFLSCRFAGCTESFN